MKPLRGTSELRPWLWLFGAALAARLIYWAEAFHGPYLGYLFLDSAAWFQRASQAAAGMESPEAYFRAPLYHWLLTAQFFIFGPNYLTPPLIQHVLGALSVVLIALTARRFYGPRAGWIAGGIAAGYAPFIFYEGEILDTSLQILLTPLLLWLLARWLEKPGRGRAVAVGAAFGLMAISRPNALLFFPVFWLGARAALRRIRAPQAGRLPLAGALISGLVVCAFVLPVALRNYAVAGDWVWTGWYGGVNFFIGNNPNADGVTSRTPARYREFDSAADSVEIFARREAEARLGRPLKGSEIDRYWFAEGWRFVREQPARWMRLAWKKFWLFWVPFEIPNIKALQFVLEQTRWLRALSWVFNLTVLMPLALAGMALGHRRREASGQSVPSVLGGPVAAPAAWLPAAFALTYAVSVVLFFVNARYRLPAVPALVILGALAIDRGWQCLEARRWKALAAGGSAVVALGVVLSLNWYGVRATRQPAEDYWTLGNAAKSRNELPQALAYYQRALKIRPDYPEAWNSIGEARYARTETRPDAPAAFERAIALARPNPAQRSSLPLYLNNLGAAREMNGDLRGAESAYREALALEPDHVIAWTNLGDVARQSGRPAEAAEHYRKALSLRPAHAPAHAGLWRLALDAGDEAAARSEARWLELNAPQLLRGHGETRRSAPAPRPPSH